MDKFQLERKCTKFNPQSCFKTNIIRVKCKISDIVDQVQTEHYVQSEDDLQCLKTQIKNYLCIKRDNWIYLRYRLTVIHRI